MQHLFEVILPAMVDLVLSAPNLCTMVSDVSYEFSHLTCVEVQMQGWEAKGWTVHVIQDELMTYNWLIMNGLAGFTARTASLEKRTGRAEVCLASCHPDDVFCSCT